MFANSGEVPNENAGGCLNTSFCCKVGPLVTEGVKLSLVCLLVFAMVGNFNAGVCWVPNGFGLSVVEVSGLNIDEKPVGGFAVLGAEGMPNEPVEAKENPLDVEGLKGVGVRLKGLALGLSFDGSLLVVSCSPSVVDSVLSRVCSSSESPMNRGSLSNVDDVSTEEEWSMRPCKRA